MHFWGAIPISRLPARAEDSITHSTSIWGLHLADQLHPALERQADAPKICGGPEISVWWGRLKAYSNICSQSILNKRNQIVS